MTSELEKELAMRRLREAAQAIVGALADLPDVREVIVSIEGVRIIRVGKKPGSPT